MDIIEKESIKKLEKFCGEENSGFDIKLISEHKPADMNETLIKLIKGIAEKSGYKYEMTPSGAFHDSLILTEVFRSAMIFVPSVNGISHCKEEYTESEDIEKGCELLLKTVLELDQRFDIT